MRNRLVACSLLVTAIGTAALPAAAQTAEQSRRIANGEVVTWIEDSGQPIKNCVAIGLIDAPADKVYKAMIDYANYPKVFRTLSSTSVLKNDGNDLTCRFTMSPPWPFTERWVVTRNHLEPAKRTVQFRMIDGNIKTYDGFISAQPWGANKTKFTYKMRVDPGIAMLPAWAVTWGTRTSLPGVVRDIGKYVKSH